MAKKARRRARRPRRRRNTESQTEIPFKYKFVLGCFNILPPHIFHANVLRHLKFITQSISQQRHYLLQVPKIPYRHRAAFPAFETNKDFWSIQDFPHVMEAVSKIRRSRFLFRILLHHWRYRRLHLVNAQDVATLEAPKKPIFVVDWDRRAKNQYEATTFMRDITERLMKHDGFFDTPQEIRNPFTNNPLTQAQTISVWNQLSYAGIPVSTAFSAFRQSRWNLTKFAVEYGRNLQLHAFRKTMLDTRHEDCIERLLDFIEYVYDQEDCACNSLAYKYVVNKFPDHTLIKSWASVCTKYYETSIMYENRDMILMTQDSVLEGAVKLLNKQQSIILLYNSHRRYGQAEINIVGEH